mmetsp:Transcript_5731/g.17636  ORF Transcript_5731/g.17636 Transcript_5731/m.17636 type:complete len:92 (-) Transcript_5731:2347-2622(-)
MSGSKALAKLQLDLPKDRLANMPHRGAEFGRLEWGQTTVRLGDTDDIIRNVGVRPCFGGALRESCYGPILLHVFVAEENHLAPPLHVVLVT